MHPPLHVYYLFRPGERRPVVAEGLELTWFDRFRADRREATPFRGPGAARVNSGEAFFAETVEAVRDGGVHIASPFGSGELRTSDVVACPSTPWATVPLYIARFRDAEPVALVKRGLSWCTDLGLVFPRRRLYVSFQAEDRRLAQDLADLEHAEHWWAAEGASAFDTTDPDKSRAACVLLGSGHFAHHLWNELSVLEGLVSAGLHRQVFVAVNQQPVADIATLFPELPADHIEVIPGDADQLARTAVRRDWLVAPAGRRHVPSSLVQRVLGVARSAHREAAAAAAAFRARHALIVWCTLRLEARTAINIDEALARLVTVLAERYAGLGVIVDGFTTPSGAPDGWNAGIIDAEQRGAPALQAALTAIDHVVLIGRPTTEAFVWATTVDYYVTPYGSAQHKVAWLHPVAGLVHAGENKRAVAGTDAGFYVRQHGPPPRFFFTAVTRQDTGPDLRTDLLSYTLDVEAFVRAVVDDIEERVRQVAPDSP